MKLLLDEMYTGYKESFEALGWEVLTVEDIGMKGEKDKVIVEYAKKNNLVLITEDRDSAELAELLGVKYVHITKASIAKIASDKLREKYPDLI